MNHSCKYNRSKVYKVTKILNVLRLNKIYFHLHSKIFLYQSTYISYKIIFIHKIYIRSSIKFLKMDYIYPQMADEFMLEGRLILIFKIDKG